MWICNFNQICKRNHIASKAKGLFNECWSKYNKAEYQKVFQDFKS